MNSESVYRGGNRLNKYYISVYNPYRVSRLSSVVERVAFNHVVVGSIPTDGEHFYFLFVFRKINLIKCELLYFIF